MRVVWLSKTWQNHLKLLEFFLALIDQLIVISLRLLAVVFFAVCSTFWSTIKRSHGSLWLDSLTMAFV